MSAPSLSDASETAKCAASARRWQIAEWIAFALLLVVSTVCAIFFKQLLDLIEPERLEPIFSVRPVGKLLITGFITWSWLMLACWGMSRQTFSIPLRILAVLGILIVLWFSFLSLYCSYSASEKIITGPTQFRIPFVTADLFWLPLFWTITVSLCALWQWGILSSGQLIVRLFTTIAGTFVLLYLLAELAGPFTNSATSAFIWNQTWILAALLAVDRFFFGRQVVRESEQTIQQQTGRRFGLGSMLLVMSAAAAVMAMARHFELLNPPTSFRLFYSLTAVMPVISVQLLWLAAFTKGLGQRLAWTTFAIGLAILSPVLATLLMAGMPNIPRMTPGLKRIGLVTENFYNLYPGFGFNEFGRSTHWTAWWTAGCLLYALPWLFFLRNCGYRLADQNPTATPDPISTKTDIAIRDGAVESKTEEKS